MIQRLRDLLFGDQGDGRDDDRGDDLPLAAAALLVEAATLDDDFAAAERGAVATLLRERFDLSEREAAALVAAAERRVDRSQQILGFTRVIKDSLPYEERVRVVEMLWEVAYADGEADDFETGLIRRVCGLLFVADRDSGAARKRVLARLDTPGAAHT